MPRSIHKRLGGDGYHHVLCKDMWPALVCASLALLPGVPNVSTSRSSVHKVAMRKVSMHAERDWTPLRDGIVSAGRHIQSSLSAVSCMSPSDLLRFAQHEAKVLMSGEPLRQLVAQMNADSAEIPAEDEFVLGEQVAPITSHTTRVFTCACPPCCTRCPLALAQEKAAG